MTMRCSKECIAFLQYYMSSRILVSNIFLPLFAIVFLNLLIVGPAIEVSLTVIYGFHR
jgi:hypothetical protein